MCIRLFFICCLTALTSLLHAQDSIPQIDSKFLFGLYGIQYDFTREEINAASRLIYKLRNDTIIVRLKTNKKQIDAYRKSGDNKTAAKIEEKSLVKNLRIISACIKYFNFCPIYFMDSEMQEYFTDTDTLITSDLVPTAQKKIALNHKTIYYLDFGQLYARERSSEWKYKDYGKTMEGGSTISDDAFVIRNYKGEQLAPPFPFYSVITLQGGKKSKERAEPIDVYIKLGEADRSPEIKKSLEKVNEWDAAILKLNYRLIYYFSKVTGASTLAEQTKNWYDKNPNKHYYDSWAQIEKKLQSILNKESQFTKQ
jgi:hypothetical protein